MLTIYSCGHNTYDGIFGGTERLHTICPECDTRLRVYFMTTKIQTAQQNLNMIDMFDARVDAVVLAKDWAIENPCALGRQQIGEKPPNVLSGEKPPIPEGLVQVPSLWGRFKAWARRQWGAEI